MHHRFKNAHWWCINCSRYYTVEVVGSAIPALALMFAWNSDDAERFAKIVGALGISTAYAGNPLGAIVVMVGLAKSFQKR